MLHRFSFFPINGAVCSTTCWIVQAAEARRQEPIVPPTNAAATSDIRPVARNTSVATSRTVNPATHNGSAVTCDPPTDSSSNTHSPSGPASKATRPGADRSHESRAAGHQLSPSATNGAATGDDSLTFRRASVADVSAHRSSPAGGYGGGMYESRRASREHNPPADVEVLEVNTTVALVAIGFSVPGVDLEGSGRVFGLRTIFVIAVCETSSTNNGCDGCMRLGLELTFCLWAGRVFFLFFFQQPYQVSSVGRDFDRID